MIRTIIIEDELEGRELLNNTLRDYCPQIAVVGMATDVPEGIALIQNVKPDLIFLDVELKGETGFTLLRAFPNPKFKVIFYTGYSHYAVKAIKFSALDILLKPLNIEDDLIPAVAKAVKELERKDKEIQWEQQRQAMSDYYDKPKNVYNKMVIPSAMSIEMLTIQDIIRCEASKDFTIFYLHSKKQCVSSYGIGYYEDCLREYDFFRIHNSHLINYHYIQRFNKLGEQGEVIMTDGSVVPVSRRLKNDFLHWLNSPH